jgi:unsaturated rhamnogalacturonyl hydrolase
MIHPLQTRIDNMIADPKPGREEWWWCDALFMAPPALAGLSAATGQLGYIDLMNAMWWDSTGLLYDEACRLFYRDERFIKKAGRSGSDTECVGGIFWGRGNGWVMAGLVRVLQFMPADYPHRLRYASLLRDMAGAIASCQDPVDGLWRADLLHPATFPAPETSGSALFCYALTWGINQGFLDRDDYLPVVLRAWKGLGRLVDEAGRVGFVQMPGDRPAMVLPGDSMEYGAGTMLLAGSEIVQMIE